MHFRNTIEIVNMEVVIFATVLHIKIAFNHY